MNTKSMRSLVVVIVLVLFPLLNGTTRMHQLGNGLAQAGNENLPALADSPQDKSLVLVGPGVRCVIIKADAPNDYFFPFTAYTFPYTGGDVHFKRYADYITGQNIPVITASEFETENSKRPFDTRIWVGLQPRTRQVLAEQIPLLDDDGFAIKTVGKDVYLTGKNIWGTEWAVYDLLEKFAGCRWYAPGPAWWRPKEEGVAGLFQIIPRSKSIQIPANLTILENPSFKMRWMRQVSQQEFRVRYRDRFHHNLITPIIPAFPNSPRLPEPSIARDPVKLAAYYIDYYNSFFSNVVSIEPPALPTDPATLNDVGKFSNSYAEYYKKHYPIFYAKWTAAHLEYFPEINGKRTVPPFENMYDFQPCIGSRKVYDALIKAAAETFASGEGTYSIGMNDSNKYCECQLCEALVPQEIKNRLPEKNQRIAYAYFTFYNKIAGELSTKYPDKRLGCLAYAGLSSLPPGMVKLHPMIVPYLTRDSAQLFDKNEVAEFSELVSRWGSMCSRMGIYEYVYGAGFVVPRIYNRYILKNIANRYNVGVDAFYGESAPNWALDGMKYWLISKMLWNNTLNPNELENDYLENCFGPAKASMQKYFDCLEDAWCTQEDVGIKGVNSNYRWMNNVIQLGIFTPEICEKSWALLLEAQQTIDQCRASETNKEKLENLKLMARRVDFYKKGFNLTRTLATSYDSGRRLEKMIESKELYMPGVMEILSSVFRLPTIDRVYEEIHGVNEIGLVPVSAAENDYSAFCYNFGRHPGINKMIHRITLETTRAAVKESGRDPVKVHQAIDMILQRQAGTNNKNKESFNRLSHIVKTTGVFFVRHTDKAPLLDGRIVAGEWGNPSYSGYFFENFSLVADANKTTIWAMEDGKKLYMAFDCEGDPSVMGADVKPGEADPGAYPKKARDDAIALNFLQQSASAKSIIVNMNGATSAEPFEVKTSRTAKGWQVEMALSMKMLNQMKQNELFPICISRYTRVKKIGAKNSNAFETVCSTLMPVADVGGTVGNGNFPACMSFVWGPLLVYQNQESEPGMPR